jgi:hypothetical protein
MRAKNTAHRYAHTLSSTHSVREGVRKWRKSMTLLRAQVCVLDVQTKRTYTPCVFDTGGVHCRAEMEEKRREGTQRMVQREKEN